MTLMLLFGCLMLDEWTLIPDGSVGGKDRFLGAGTTLAATDSGRIYLLDPSAFQVFILDRDLKEIARFGRKGKGPGEFEEPKSIVLTPEGKPAVFDPTLKRITIFEVDGEVIETLPLDTRSVAVYHPASLTGGHFAFLSARSHEGKPVYDLAIYDRKAAMVSNLVRIETEPLDWSKSSEPAFWVDFLRNELALIGKGLPVACALDGQTLVYGRTNQYQLHLVDRDGRPMKTVERRVKPVPLTEASQKAAFEAVWNRLTVDPFLFNNMPRSVLERAMLKAESPPILPYVKAVTRFGKGFAVLAQYDDHKHSGRFDLFDREGGYLGGAPYKGPAGWVTGNREHLFTVGSDQDGEVIIMRMRVK